MSIMTIMEQIHMLKTQVVVLFNSNGLINKVFGVSAKCTLILIYRYDDIRFFIPMNYHHRFEVTTEYNSLQTYRINYLFFSPM